MGRRTRLARFAFGARPQIGRGARGRSIPALLHFTFTVQAVSCISVRTNDLHTMLQVQPFRPFKIRLADQRALLVNHSEYVPLHPGEPVMVYWSEKGGFEIISLDQIASLEATPKSQVKTSR